MLTPVPRAPQGRVETAELVSEMRLLLNRPASDTLMSGDASPDERAFSIVAPTALMVLLAFLILAFTALPDLLPVLGNVLQAHL